jgi:hypothetical protein
LALRDEGSGVQVLIALTPQLTDIERQQAINVALSLRSLQHRADLLAAFVSSIYGDKLILKDPQRAMVELISSLASLTREQALETVADSKIFSTEVLPNQLRDAVILSIVEVCQDWKWS